MPGSHPCAEIFWNIENFSFCWHKHKEVLCSPVVCVQSLWGSRWNLQLYPKGWNAPDHVGLFLSRKEDSSKMEEINVKYELSVLDVEGSPLKYSYSYSNAFKKSSTFGHSLFLEFNLLDDKKEVYLPGDVLTVHSLIWPLSVESSGVSVFRLRTNIPVYKRDFLWCAFDDFGAEPKTSLTIPLNRDDTVSVDLQQVCDQNEKHIEVVIDADIGTISWTCDISDFHTGEELLHLADKLDTHPLPYKKRFRLAFPPSTTDNNREKKSKRTSKVNFVLILHTLIDCEELQINYQLKKITESVAGSTSEIKKEVDKRSYYSVKQDIRNIYSKGVLTDSIVKVQDKLFPVHSLILSLRSPILSSMLETSKKECRPDSGAG